MGITADCREMKGARRAVMGNQRGVQGAQPEFRAAPGQAHASCRLLLETVCVSLFLWWSQTQASPAPRALHLIMHKPCLKRKIHTGIKFGLNKSMIESRGLYINKRIN